MTDTNTEVTKVREDYGLLTDAEAQVALTRLNSGEATDLDAAVASVVGERCAPYHLPEFQPGAHAQPVEPPQDRNADVVRPGSGSASTAFVPDATTEPEATEEPEPSFPADDAEPSIPVDEDAEEADDKGKGKRSK